MKKTVLFFTLIGIFYTTFAQTSSCVSAAFKSSFQLYQQLQAELPTGVSCCDTTLMKKNVFVAQMRLNCLMQAATIEEILTIVGDSRFSDICCNNEDASANERLVFVTAKQKIEVLEEQWTKSLLEKPAYKTMLQAAGKEILIMFDCRPGHSLYTECNTRKPLNEYSSEMICFLLYSMADLGDGPAWTKSDLRQAAEKLKASDCAFYRQKGEEIIEDWIQ